MNRIEKISALYYQANNYTQNEKNFKQTTSQQPRTDQLSFSSNSIRHTLEKEYRQLYSELKEQYTDIEFVTEQIVTGRENTPISSIGNTNRKHILYITDDYMKQLFGDEDTYLTKTDILKNIANKLSKYSTKTSVWLDSNKAIFLQGNSQTNNILNTALKSIQDTNAKYNFPSKSEQENKSQYNSKSSDMPNVSKVFSKIARAKSKDVIYAVMNDVQKDLLDLQLALAFQKGKVRAKTQAIIKALRKSLTKGHDKIKRLESEEMSKLREKIAREKQEREREMEEARKLRKKQADRKKEENSMVREGDDAQRQIDELERQIREENKDTALPEFTIKTVNSSCTTNTPNNMVTFSPSSSQEIISIIETMEF